MFQDHQIVLDALRFNFYCKILGFRVHKHLIRVQIYFLSLVSDLPLIMQSGNFQDGHNFHFYKHYDLFSWTLYIRKIKRHWTNLYEGKNPQRFLNSNLRNHVDFLSSLLVARKFRAHYLSENHVVINEILHLLLHFFFLIKCPD